MPSGSHGGSRGGHSSGGSRSGGSRSGGSHRGGSSHRSGGGYFRPMGPRYFYFGRRRYYLSPRRRQTVRVLGVLAAVSIFIAIIGLVMMFSGNSDIKTIKADYNYYQNMIAYTDQNPNRIRTATVADRFQGDGTSKWYITYTMELDVRNGQETHLKGYSYSVYTMEEAADIMNAHTIKIAVNMDLVDSKTDSIPMDYRNMPLNRDGHYNNAQNTKLAGQVMLISGIAIAVILIVCDVKLTFSQRATAEAQAKAANTSASTQKTDDYTYCSYCGARVRNNEAKCNNCGASIK